MNLNHLFYKALRYELRHWQKIDRFLTRHAYVTSYQPWHLTEMNYIK